MNCAIRTLFLQKYRRLLVVFTKPKKTTMAKILLVDDEPSVLHVLALVLRRQGHDVTPSDAVQAQSMLRTESFDLLISDIQMQPVDGLELQAFARAACPQMATVMMSACATVEQAVESMRQGAADYLIKPFKPGELIPIVQRVTARAS